LPNTIEQAFKWESVLIHRHHLITLLSHVNFL